MVCELSCKPSLKEKFIISLTLDIHLYLKNELCCIFPIRLEIFRPTGYLDLQWGFMPPDPTLSTPLQGHCIPSGAPLLKTVHLKLFNKLDIALTTIAETMTRTRSASNQLCSLAISILSGGHCKKETDLRSRRNVCHTTQISQKHVTSMTSIKTMWYIN